MIRWLAYNDIDIFFYLFQCFINLLKRIRGVKIAWGSPILNHLFFMDDKLLFYQANKKEWEQIQNLLGVNTSRS